MDQTGPCGPCLPPGQFATPFGGPGSGLWPAGSPIQVPGPTLVAGTGVGPVLPPVIQPRGPAAVNFQSAQFFKILAKSGISNIPTSQVIGNIGVSPITSAAITGFALTMDPGGQTASSAQVVGKVYAPDFAPPTPALVSQAVLDMQAAYVDAASRVPNFVDLNGGNLGGLSLIPGTYKFNTNVTIPTNLTLVGGPGDTWIFQISGTLNVASGVQIVLSGGALPKNVFWQVAGATTIGTNATFRGNILDLTNIAVQTGASVFGKLLAQTAVTLDNNLVNG